MGRDLPRQAGLLTERLAAIRSRRLLLAKALLGARGYRMSDTDELAFGAAVDLLSGQAGGNTALTDMTIPQVWAALRTPTTAVLEAASARNQREFTELTRSMTAALQRARQGQPGRHLRRPVHRARRFHRPDPVGVAARPGTAR